MLALLFFFAILYFLLPLRMFFMKSLRVEATLVLIFSSFPVIYYYVTVDKGSQVGALFGAEAVVIALALLSFASYQRFFFLCAYFLNITIFLVLFLPDMVKHYHETMKYFRGHG